MAEKVVRVLVGDLVVATAEVFALRLPDSVPDYFVGWRPFPTVGTPFGVVDELQVALRRPDNPNAPLPVPEVGGGTSTSPGGRCCLGLGTASRRDGPREKNARDRRG